MIAPPSKSILQRTVRLKVTAPEPDLGALKNHSTNGKNLVKFTTNMLTNFQNIGGKKKAASTTSCHQDAMEADSDSDPLRVSQTVSSDEGSDGAGHDQNYKPNQEDSDADQAGEESEEDDVETHAYRKSFVREVRLKFLVLSLPDPLNMHSFRLLSGATDLVKQNRPPKMLPKSMNLVAKRREEVLQGQPSLPRNRRCLLTILLVSPMSNTLDV